MPQLFIAARSSRHRRACFALYRSLLRQAPHVPLPNDVATALGPTNPIKTLIRNAFRRNKRDNSPRLIVSALKNGYRALTLLSRAADPSTPEHSSVLTFLRENNARVQSVLAKRAVEAEAAAKLSTAPIPGRTTLLTRVTAEGVVPPVYVPTNPPRKLEDIPSGVRKPPTLSDTGGVPFLRLRRPQPRFLERVLRQKSRQRSKNMARYGEMQEEDMEVAGWEDKWEGMMKVLGKREGVEVAGQDVEGDKDGEAGKKATYVGSLREAIGLLSEKIELERVDMVARAHAMWQIVRKEQELALEEERERMVREGRVGEEVVPRVWKRPSWATQARRRAKRAEAEKAAAEKRAAEENAARVEGEKP